MKLFQFVQNKITSTVITVLLTCSIALFPALGISVLAKDAAEEKATASDTTKKEEKTTSAADAKKKEEEDIATETRKK